MKTIRTEYYITDGDGSNEICTTIHHKSLIKETTCESIFGFVRVKRDIILVSPKSNFVSKHESWDDDRAQINKMLIRVKKDFQKLDEFCNEA